MRLLGIFLALAVLFLIPFLIWGESSSAALSDEGTVTLLRTYGRWAWVAGIALLVSDTVLPIPATAVIAALGYVYGPVGGGLIGALGSFLSGATAYGFCRLLGRRAALWLVGPKDLDKGERLFRSLGGWLVALSRWMPLLPEVIACMAGLTRMPPQMFLLALACGCVPLGFAYAMVGHAGVERPWLALTLSLLVPPALWLLIGPRLKRRAVDREPDA